MIQKQNAQHKRRPKRCEKTGPLNRKAWSAGRWGPKKIKSSCQWWLCWGECMKENRKEKEARFYDKWLANSKFPSNVL